MFTLLLLSLPLFTDNKVRDYTMTDIGKYNNFLNITNFSTYTWMSALRNQVLYFICT